jgi:VIT1/CCC1 family predicted Fe2+/Mn2+ transporter
MGVAGATEAGGGGVLIAGLAGLLAGGFSMALGEWLSVQSSRELYEEQIAVEREELEMAPQEEEAELALIYQAKGIPEELALRLAAQVIASPEAALDTLAREELGVDPDTLGGSAWEAAFASFLLFCLGAVVPVFPFFFASGAGAVMASLAVSALALFGVGAGITLVTGKSAWRSGLRQTLFGMVAAGVTFGIGTLLGAAITG